MIFKVVINYYDDLNEEEIKKGLFLMAKSYVDATEKLAKYYGEDNLLEVKTIPWSPDSFIEFDLDNPDEDWLFNKVDNDIGKNVFW